MPKWSDYPLISIYELLFWRAHIDVFTTRISSASRLKQWNIFTINRINRKCERFRVFVFVMKSPKHLTLFGCIKLWLNWDVIEMNGYECPCPNESPVKLSKHLEWLHFKPHHSVGWKYQQIWHAWFIQKLFLKNLFMNQIRSGWCIAKVCHSIITAESKQSRRTIKNLWP